MPTLCLTLNEILKIQLGNQTAYSLDSSEDISNVHKNARVLWGDRISEPVHYRWTQILLANDSNEHSI